MPETTIEQDVKRVCEELLGWSISEGLYRRIQSGEDESRTYKVELDANLAHEVKQAVRDKDAGYKRQFLSILDEKSRPVDGYSKTPFAVTLLLETPELIIECAAAALRAGKGTK